jgi:hypothetical protein
MPSLISEKEKAELALIFGDIFDTFKRKITIYKAPKKALANTANKPMAGYEEDSEEGNISYVTEQKEFEAVITYGDRQSEVASQVGTYEAGTVKIRVKKDASDYIENGKTEKIEVDGKSFNTITDSKVSDFMGARYYIYYLRATT